MVSQAWSWIQTWSCKFSDHPLILLFGKTHSRKRKPNFHFRVWMHCFPLNWVSFEQIIRYIYDIIFSVISLSSFEYFVYKLWKVLYNLNFKTITSKVSTTLLHPSLQNMKIFGIGKWHFEKLQTLFDENLVWLVGVMYP